MYSRPILKEILIATAEITESSEFDQLSKRIDEKVTSLAQEVWATRYKNDDELLNRLNPVANKKRLSEQKGLLFQELGNLMLSSSKKESSFRTYRDCHNYLTKWLAVFEMLVERRHHRVADYIGQKLLKKAALIGSYSTMIAVYKFKQKEAFDRNSKRQWNILEKKLVAVVEKAKMVELAGQLNLNTKIWLHNGAQEDPEFGEISESYRELSKHINDIDAPEFHFNLIECGFIINRFGRIKESKDLIDSSLQYLARCPFQYYYAYATMLFWKIRCQLSEGKTELALKTLDACENYLRDGEDQWFIHKELLLIALFHASRIDEARALYVEVQGHRDFDIISPIIKERIALLGGYIDLLKAFETVDNDPGTFDFRIHKFLNEIPIISSYRSSWNIPVLILQLASYIVTDNKKHLHSRVDATAKYLNRYLRGDGVKRSRYIIKMMLSVAKKNWDPYKLKKATKTRYQRITAEPRAIDFRIEWEVIPYDKLWNHLEAYVERNYRKEYLKPRRRNYKSSTMQSDQIKINAN